jgi:hypothetical protein
MAALEPACAEVGRDPATIGRSAGLAVETTSVSGAAEVLAERIRGSAAQIADAFREFHAAAFDHIEVVLWPPTLPSSMRPPSLRLHVTFANAERLRVTTPDPRGTPVSALWLVLYGSYRLLKTRVGVEMAFLICTAVPVVAVAIILEAGTRAIFPVVVSLMVGVVLLWGPVIMSDKPRGQGPLDGASRRSTERSDRTVASDEPGTKAR